MEMFSNAAMDVLDGSINDSQTTLDVVDASEFPATGVFPIIVEGEIMRVTGVSGETFTVVRGDEGTTPASHASGVRVTHIVTERSMKAMVTDRTTIVDTYANRPSAGEPGRLFIPSDGPVWFRDTGSLWKPVAIGNYLNQPPAANTFTAVNNTDATLTDEAGTLLLKASPNNGNKWQLFVVDPGSPPYTLTVCVLFGFFNPATATDAAMGVCFWATGGGTDHAELNFRQLAATGDQSCRPVARRWGSYIGTITGLHNVTAALGSVPFVSPNTPVWLRIQDDGSSRILFISYDGIQFIQLHSENRATGFTANRIGLSINNHTSSTTPLADSYMRVIGWESSF